MLLVPCRHPALFAGVASQYNVLFIAVDDLRPELACYGAAHIVSPNIDRLAAQGMIFTRAYCQQAICNASRASLLTGCRPDTTRVYNLTRHFRDTLPDVVTLPQHFKNHGYHVRGLGKIYHGHGQLDDPPSWSVPWWKPRTWGSAYFTDAGRELARRLRGEKRNGGKTHVIGMPWESPDVDDGLLADGLIARQAARILGDIRDKPFFLAVGFLKPHLPFVAPRKYWDLYPASSIRLPDNPNPPDGAPPYALSNWGELRRAYAGIPRQGPLREEQARNMRRGYYACVSFVDAQIGLLLEALAQSGLEDNTIVILWGDHGWHLGEHGLWCKHTNFENAVRAPLIIRVPHLKHGGTTTDALVEFVDIYPSLCELCDLPLPEFLEGSSFVPLLHDPDRRWKKAVFSQYPRRIHGRPGMGYSLRTRRYRFTEWIPSGRTSGDMELYDYDLDPQENVNVARHPDKQAVVRELRKLLHDGWKASIP